MEIIPLQRKVVASDIPAEKLAGNSQLSQREKIAEASRQFESMLLRQILDNTQKTVIKSKLSDDSMSSSIYRGQVTAQLADSISKSGNFGLAKAFEHQLNRPSDLAPVAKTQSPAPSGAPKTSPRQHHGRPHPTLKTP